MKSSAFKLLIVEDSVELCSIWQQLFNAVGYAPVFCNNGAEALQEISKGFVPDLVMTDYYLPDTTGLDLIERLEQQDLDAKYIMVTGNRDQDFCDSVRKKISALTLLHKPVKFAELKAHVDRLAT